MNKVEMERSIEDLTVKLQFLERVMAKNEREWKRLKEKLDAANDELAKDRRCRMHDEIEESLRLILSQVPRIVVFRRCCDPRTTRWPIPKDILRSTGGELKLVMEWEVSCPQE